MNLTEKMNSRLLLILFTLFCAILSLNLWAEQPNDYEKNLKAATKLYLFKQEISDTILLKLVPKNELEFDLLYDTTNQDNELGKTSFFYETTRLIFDKVIKEDNDKFYLPSLKLISFADGEFGEEFIQHLELIIKLDNQKFCDSMKGKDFANNNPLKYYIEKYKCE